MVVKQTYLNVLDNSSPTKVLCIEVYNKKKVASLGSRILVTVKKVKVNKKLIGRIKAIKKSDLSRAVVVQIKKNLDRRNGTFIKFDFNSCLILNKEDYLVGTRILGPVPVELKGYKFGSRLTALAPAVV